MFAIVNMMRITGVVISKKSKCAEQKAEHHRSSNFESNFETFEKHCKSYIHCVRQGGNDELNYVCHSWRCAHHRSRNFENVKMCKTNCNYEKFETHSKSYIQCVRHVGNDDLTMFAMLNIVAISVVEISKTSKCAKQTALSKSLKTL